MTAVVVIEAVVIVGLVVLVGGLLRSHAEILRRLHQLGAGETQTPIELGTSRHGPPASSTPIGDAPDHIAGVTPAGAQTSIALRGSRGHTLLAFLSSGCRSCHGIWQRLAEGSPADDLPIDRVVVVAKSPDDESVSAVADLAPPNATTVMSSDAWKAFAVPYTPYFALVDGRTGRVIGDGTAGTWDQVTSLVSRSLGDQPPPGTRRSTVERLEDSETELRQAGIEPGDPALYRRPTDGP